MRRLLALALTSLLTFAALVPGLAMACRKAPAGEHSCCCKAARENVICAPDCCDLAKPGKPQPIPTRPTSGQVLMATAWQLPRCGAPLVDPPRLGLAPQPPIANSHAPPVPLRI